MEPCIAFLPFGQPGWQELLIVMIIALLLFGKRLPEVARNLGKGIVEFKKGVRGIEDEVNTSYSQSSSTPSSRPVPREETVETTAPKFEPPKSAPTEAPADSSH
jgi:sec-independent protein translocase protein TatA